MSRSLDFFELAYDDVLVAQGEDLYDAAAVKEIIKVDRHLYSVNVSESSFTHEVEVLKPKLKSRDTTCDCRQYHENKACRHIVAALFALRKLIDEEEQEQFKKRKKTGQKLSIASILEEIPSEDLQSFVRGYAKRDKNFATLMKAHFARRVKGRTTMDKYKSILGTVIKPVQTAEVKILQSQVRLYVHVCEELVAQLEDAVVLEEYVEAIEIWQACMHKNEYVFRYTDLLGASVDKLALRLAQVAKDLLQVDMSPSLAEHWKDTLVGVAELSYYRFRSVLQNPLELLIRHGDLSEAWQYRLLDTCATILTDTEDEDEQAIILALQTRIAIGLGQEVAVSDIIDKIGGRLSQYIRYMLQANDYEAARIMSEQVVGEGHKLPVVNKTLIEIYEHQGANRKLRKLAYDAFIDTHELRYFDLLKKHTKADRWYRVRGELLEQIDNKGVRTESLRRDHDWAALVEELHDQGDIDLAMRYTSYLKVYEPEALAGLYKDLIRDYLNSHIGTKASDYIEEILLFLEREGAVPAIKAIVRLLDSEFAHRKSLGIR